MIDLYEEKGLHVCISYNDECSVEAGDSRMARIETHFRVQNAHVPFVLLGPQCTFVVIAREIIVGQFRRTWVFGLRAFRMAQFQKVRTQSAQ